MSGNESDVQANQTNVNQTASVNETALPVKRELKKKLLKEPIKSDIEALDHLLVEEKLLKESREKLKNLDQW